MRRYSQRNNLSTLSEINITPLLDLAFVLLIIFMITTPLLESSVNLVIPSSGEKNPAIQSSQVQTISIDRNETVQFNNRVVDPAMLTAIASLGEEWDRLPPSLQFGQLRWCHFSQLRLAAGWWRF